MRKIVCALMMLVCCLLHAEEPSNNGNYIYLLDCTQSMTGYKGSPNVLSAAKMYLWHEIDNQPRDADVTILLFQKRVGRPIRCKAANFSRKKLDAEIKRMVKETTSTDICGAWLEAEKYIDPEKENHILLMTDGMDNVQGPDSLAAILSRFCGRYPNTHARYALLTKEAMLGLEPIMHVIEDCEHIELADLREEMVLGDDTLFVTTGQLPHLWHWTFSDPNTFKAHVECNDPHFKVTLVDGKIRDGRYDILIESRRGRNAVQLNDDLGQKDYKFAMKSVLDERGMKFSNPNSVIIVQCRPERLITLGAFKESKELSLERVTWQEGFLIWEDGPKTQLQVNLAPELNSYAIAESKLVLKVRDREGRNDFQLLINGREDSLLVIDSEHTKADIAITFRYHAEEGTRQFDITAQKWDELDRLNGQQIDDVKFTIVTGYHVAWHPVKWIIVITLSLTTLGLLIWFLILKPMIYPTIKTGKIIVGEPYYASHRIRGAREAVLCSTPVKQSVLNRWFTGRIVSCTNAAWTHPIVCTRGRNGLHVRLGGNYTIDPYSNKLQPGVEYIIENMSTGEKITIQAI